MVALGVGDRKGEGRERGVRGEGVMTSGDRAREKRIQRDTGPGIRETDCDRKR